MSIKSVTISVNDMVCISCEKRIDSKLKKLKGVLESKSNYEKSVTHIKYDETKCNYQDIILEIKKIGYSVSKKGKIGRAHV